MYWFVYICVRIRAGCVSRVYVYVCLFFLRTLQYQNFSYLAAFVPTTISIRLPSNRLRPTTSPPPASFFCLFVCFSSLSYLYLKIYFWMRFALLNFIPTPTFFVEPIFFFKRIHRNVIIPMRVFIFFCFSPFFKSFFCFRTVASWNRFYCSSHVQYCF